MKIAVKYWLMGLIMFVAMGFYACGDDDDDDPMPDPQTKTYTLNSVSDPDIHGTVTFEKLDAGGTRVTIELVGTESGNSHPAHIHANSVSEGGPIVIDLSPVNGATGMSEITITEQNDGTAITYEGLLAFDGYVNVHLSASELSTIIAQGDIGSNASTGGNGGNGNGNGTGY